MARLDDALKALGDHRRRQLLFALQESKSRIDAVSVPEDVVDRAAVDQAAVSYTHVHLPLLEQQGYVHWDRGRDEVTPGPRFEELEPLLGAVEEFEAQ